MGRAVTAFVAVAVCLVLAGSVSATLPPTIFYHVTLRHFLSQPCRNTSSATVRNEYCPDDADIKAQVALGNLAGHPDFEMNNQKESGNSAFNFGTVQRYRGKYSKASPAPRLPVTADPPTPTSAKPFVTSDLEDTTAGIPKMVYCTILEDSSVGCDSQIPSSSPVSSNKQVRSADSFSTWYRDDKKSNRRMAYKQTLRRSAGKYVFDSADSSKGAPANFYSPIYEQGLTSKAFPAAQKELSYNGGGTKRFWVTTEIHTSFYYRGDESFDFSGDDDVHVYINRRLAVNLGGVHEPTSVTLNIALFEEELNITKYNTYQFDMFHAERHTEQSNYKITTTLSEACNVITADFRTQGRDVETSIAWGADVSSSEWRFIAGPGYGDLIKTSSSTTEAFLLASHVKNTASYMFHAKQHNVGSGFALSFQFKLSGEGHGFAVVIHDRPLGLRDFNGGTGPNLGIRNTENSFAIVFDTCPGFPSCSAPASSHHNIRLHYKKDGNRLNDATSATRTKYDNNVIQNWRDDAWHSVEILYYEEPNWIEVYVDGSLYLIERDFSVTEIIGGRDAWVGFTTASSDSSNMEVRIKDVTMKIVKVVPTKTVAVETQSQFPKAFIANGRDQVLFTMQTHDACGNLIEYGGLSDLVHGRLIATSISDDPPSSGRRLQAGELVLLPEILDLDDGKYQVAFKTDVLANFSVHMAFGPNCTWNGASFVSNNDCWTNFFDDAAVSVPFSTFAPTSADDPLAIGTSALVGIGVASGIIALCGSIMVFVGIRMRNRWRREKAFIEEGRRVVAERNVAYVGDNELDKLQNQLQATLHAIQVERAKKYKEEDKQHIIDDLQRQRGELQEMVRRMKILRDGGDPNIDDRPAAGGRLRKSFAASRASRGVSLFKPSGPNSRASRGISLFRGQADDLDGSITTSGNPLFAGIRASLGLAPRSKPADSFAEDA